MPMNLPITSLQVMDFLGVAETAGYAGMAAIVVIRFAAIFFSLRMPALRLVEPRK